MTGFPDEKINLESAAPAEDMLVLNLEGTSDEMPELEAMPPGVYEAIVENTEFGTSQSSGNPMITWVLKVLDPEYDNRKLFYHTVLNKEPGLVRLKQILIRVCDDVDLANFSPQAFCDEGVAIGLPCRVKVRVKPYQGKRRNEVVEVLEPLSDGYMDAPY